MRMIDSQISAPKAMYALARHCGWPAAMSRGKMSSEIPPKELALLRKHVPPTKLEVFITESGLPVRVVGSLTTSDLTSAQTTEILAVNVPVDIKRPPARKTIGQAQLNRLERSRHSKGGFGGGGAIVFTGTL